MVGADLSRVRASEVCNFQKVSIVLLHAVTVSSLLTKLISDLNLFWPLAVGSRYRVCSAVL